MEQCLHCISRKKGEWSLRNALSVYSSFLKMFSFKVMGNLEKKVWEVVCNLITPNNLFYSKFHFSFTEVYTIRGLAVEVLV